jgi:hypothetical protein
MIPTSDDPSARPASFERPRVRSAADAAALVAAVGEALAGLEPLIARESDLLAAGDTAEALALAPAKSLAAHRYMDVIETVKANAIALRRLHPEGVEALRERHAAFEPVLTRNMAVLSTARAVTEGIIREVSAEVAKATETQGYGPGGGARAAMQRPKAAPLAVSKAV